MPETSAKPLNLEPLITSPASEVPAVGGRGRRHSPFRRTQVPHSLPDSGSEARCLSTVLLSTAHRRAISTLLHCPHSLSRRKRSLLPFNGAAKTAVRRIDSAADGPVFFSAPGSWERRIITSRIARLSDGREAVPAIGPLAEGPGLLPACSVGVCVDGCRPGVGEGGDYVRVLYSHSGCASGTG